MRKRDSDQEAADREIFVFHVVVFGGGAIAIMAVVIWMLVSRLG